MNPDDLNTNEDIVEAIDENGQETNSILEASLEQSARNGSISEQQLETQDRILQELQKEKEDDGMAGFFSALEMVKGKDSTVPGPKGDKGDKGEQGDTGDQGEKGEQGERGEQGLQGEQGIEGKTGKQGDKGQDGTDGAKGKDGKNGKDGSPDTPKQVKEKLLKQGIGYDELTGLPDIAKIARMSVSTKTVSLIELDDVDFSALTKNAEGKYVLGGGGSSDTLYTANGQLTGARTVDQNNHKLSLMSGDLQLGDYPNTRDNGGVTHTLGTSTQSAGMTAGGGATFSGTYTGGAGSGYVVTIGFSKGSPTGDWSWTLNGGSPTTVTGITTGSPYLLSDGISVTFNGAGTGYGDPATLSAPIDSVGVVPENILYTDINGNVLSALLDDVIPTVNTLYTADGTLAGDRIVQQAGNDLTIRSLGSGAFSNIYQTEQENHLQSQNVAGDYIATIETKIETPVFGSDRATATMTGANTTSGAESYVKADSIGAAYISGTLGVLVRTPAVHAATATVGQVLALANVPGGVEFIDAPSDKSEYIIVGASDETTALTTGTAKTTFRIPWTGTITGVRASVTTAPTDAVLTVDINKTGTGTILSTKITIDATEKTSVTAATAPVISTAGVTDDDEYTIDIDTVGSTVAGTGLKITILGTRS